MSSSRGVSVVRPSVQDASRDTSVGHRFVRSGAASGGTRRRARRCRQRSSGRLALESRSHGGRPVRDGTTCRRHDAAAGELCSREGRWSQGRRFESCRGHLPLSYRLPCSQVIGISRLRFDSSRSGHRHLKAAVRFIEVCVVSVPSRWSDRFLVGTGNATQSTPMRSPSPVERSPSWSLNVAAHTPDGRPSGAVWLPLRCGGPRPVPAASPDAIRLRQPSIRDGHTAPKADPRARPAHHRCSCRRRFVEARSLCAWAEPQGDGCQRLLLPTAAWRWRVPPRVAALARLWVGGRAQEGLAGWRVRRTAGGSRDWRSWSGRRSRQPRPRPTPGGSRSDRRAWRRSRRACRPRAGAGRGRCGGGGGRCRAARAISSRVALITRSSVMVCGG